MRGDPAAATDAKQMQTRLSQCFPQPIYVFDAVPDANVRVHRIVLAGRGDSQGQPLCHDEVRCRYHGAQCGGPGQRRCR